MKHKEQTMKMKILYDRTTPSEKGLAVINIISALMHFVFQANLFRTPGIYRGFLLTENLLISLVFFYCGVALFFGNKPYKKFLLTFQLTWWTAFFVLVLFNWGLVSTLSMFDPWFLLPQSLILAATGLTSVLLATFSLWRTQNNVSLTGDDS